MSVLQAVGDLLGKIVEVVSQWVVRFSRWTWFKYRSIEISVAALNTHVICMLYSLRMLVCLVAIGMVLFWWHWMVAVAYIEFIVLAKVICPFDPDLKVEAATDYEEVRAWLLPKIVWTQRIVLAGLSIVLTVALTILASQPPTLDTMTPDPQLQKHEDELFELRKQLDVLEKENRNK